MTHNERCRYAKSKRNRCECDCGGALHGFDLADVSDLRPLGEAMGGEVADIIRKTAGAVLPKNSFCPHEIVVVWSGYPHDGGVPDTSGEKWWMVAECGECYCLVSWWKVLRRLDALKGETVVVR